jgi:hypothetical protein
MNNVDAMTMLENEHEAKRAALARAAYVRWKMGDLPPIYCELMPYSYHISALMEAEKGIRSQVAQDQKHLASPWRQIGPGPGSIFTWDVTPEQKIAFGVEVAIPVGMTDAPKVGREDDPAVQAAMTAAMGTPEYKRVMAKRDANVKRMEALQAWREASIALQTPPEGTDVQAESQKVADLERAYQEAEAAFKALS